MKRIDTLGRAGAVGWMLFGGILCLAFLAQPVVAKSPGIYKDGVKIVDFEEVIKNSLPDILTKEALPQAAGVQRIFQDAVSQRDMESVQTQRKYFQAVVAWRDLVNELTATSPPAEDMTATADDVFRLSEQYLTASQDLADDFTALAQQLESNAYPDVIVERHATMMARHTEAAGELAALITEFETASDAGNFGAWSSTLEELARYFVDEKIEPEDPVYNTGEAPVMMEIRTAPQVQRSQVPSSRKTGAYPLAAGAEDFDPEDLLETIDVQFTTEITNLAASLGNSPAKLYEWVHNNVEFEPYLGSRKGSQQTFVHKKGNDYDIASLLLALYRSSGMPARYATGTIEMDVDDAMSWLGFTDAQNAANILTTVGMEGVAVVDGPEVVAIRSRRVWVEAYLPIINYRGTVSDSVGFAWVPLDPAFKLYEYTDGFNIPHEISYNSNDFVDEYTSTLRTETVSEYFEQKLLDTLPQLHPGATADDLVRSRTMITETDGILPGTLPYFVMNRDSSFAEIASEYRYEIRFDLHGGGVDLDYTTSTPEIVLKQVTISYKGATPADQDIIDSAGGIFNVTTPWLVNLVPVLRIDGCEVAVGTGSIQMGQTHNNDMHFTAPVGASNQQPAIFNVITAGNYQGIGIDTEDAYPSELETPQTTCLEEYLAGVLHQTALQYVHAVDVAGAKIASLMHMVITNDVSEAIVENQVQVFFSGGTPISFDWVGMSVDADRKIIGPFPTDGLGDPFDYMLTSGLDGSLQENRLFERLYDEEAVSTTKILSLAADSGIAVCKITSSIGTDCPTLNQPVNVVNAINNALAQGHEVIIPQRDFTYYEWTGTGWIDLDPVTGAAGYLISGGINGGATVQDWSAELAALLSSSTICIEPIGPVTVTPDPDAAPDWYCGQNTARWEFTVPTINAWGVDEDDNCVLEQTLVDQKFTVTNYTIKELADNPVFGPGTYTFVIGSIFDPYGCGCTIIEKETKIYKAEITSLSPSSDLKLGTDLTVDYEIKPPEFSFDNADLEIKNTNDALVFKKPGIDGSGGAHTEKWEKGKWNQGSTPFPYANPNNSDYKVFIVGYKGGGECRSNPEMINTKLICEADLEDPLGTAGGGVSLADQAGIKDFLDALKFIMELDGVPQATLQGPGQISATFSNDFKAKVTMDDPSLNTLPDGDYKAIFRDYRDEIGNWGDKEPGTPGIQEFEFDVRLK